MISSVPPKISSISETSVWLSRTLDSSCALLSLLTSIFQFVSFAAKRTFWPPFPIARALSPAKVISVEIDEITKSARVIVADDKLSLAIGKGGQNVRLAAKLVNWKIDVKSESKASQENKLESSHTDIDDIGGIFSGTEDINLD